MRLSHLLMSLGLLLAVEARAEEPGVSSDETQLGELPITGTEQEHITKLAVLPSLSPDLEDVKVRAVVRGDLELSGLFDVIADTKAPAGLYGFEDPVDIDAWRKVGAEVIVKVSAQTRKDGKVKVFGLAYFLNVGRDPVYKKTLVVDVGDVRVTGHRVTDALLGAITGREGGFASRLTFAGKWTNSQVVFTMDADGHNLARITEPRDFSVAPTWGPGGSLFYAVSRDYSPFSFVKHGDASFKLPFSTSVYGADFSKDGKQLAIAVAQSERSAIHVGNPDGSGMKRTSTSELAMHPVFSPLGKLAWVGASSDRSAQRIFLDGKPVSPAGFSASAPTFCDTEDGVFLVFSVSVGNNRRDLVMASQQGGLTRLTQNQGSNTYPACSPDGRLLAFFSTRATGEGLYVMSLKRFTAKRISGRVGQSLRWAALPPTEQSLTSD